MEGKQNAEKYTEVLEKSFLPFLANIYQNDAIFRQDNAAVYTAKLISKWLQDHNIAIMSWHAKFPDLNPIENLRSLLTRDVNIDARRFEGKEMLWCAVKKCWEAISNDTLLNLINSMNNRCVDVLQVKGSACKLISLFVCFGIYFCFGKCNFGNVGNLYFHFLLP